MFTLIASMLAYPFIRRALLVGTLLCLSAALLGVILVLKRYSLIGDGLSHVGFGVMALAAALGVSTPLYIALPVVALTAIVLLQRDAHRRLPADSAIALLSSSALAIGLAVSSLAPGVNIDVDSFMFGSVLALTGSDVGWSVAVSVVIIGLFWRYYRQLFLVTSDEAFARACGVPVGRYTSVIAVLSALIIVVGMRMLGVMLISSIIIFPALSALQIGRSFRQVTLVSASIGVVCFWLGLIFSFIYRVSTGPAVILANLAVFLLLSLAGRLRR